MRALGTEMDGLDQAVADRFRLNRTDMRCVDILDREGRLTAGRLAELTGLSSGAITTAIDRLERRGLARRVRDDADRRKVYVELGDEAHNLAEQFYGEHAALAERLFQRYSEKELELLLGFVRGSREFNERKAAELESQLPGSRDEAG